MQYSTDWVDVAAVQKLLSLSGQSLMWLLKLLSVSVEVALGTTDGSSVSSEEVRDKTSRVCVPIVGHLK